MWNNGALFIEYISRYPSGDNCQPFSFNYIEKTNELEIYHDSKIAHHTFNPCNISSLISLGALIELAKTCAFLNQFEIKTEIIVQFDRTTILNSGIWAKIKFITFPQDDIKLDNLMEMRTNRGRYLKSEVNLEGTYLNDQILFKKDLSPLSLKIILDIDDRLIWKNNLVLKDIFNWLRGSIKTYHQKKDGHHYSEVNMNRFDAFCIFFIRKFLNSRYVLLNPLLLFWARRKSKINLKKTDSFALILSEFKKLEDFMELGANFIKLRFFILKYHFKSQPMSAATMIFLQQKNDFTKQDIEVIKMGEALQRSLEKDFGVNFLGLSGAWLIRLGVPEKHPMLSLRKYN